MTRFGEIRWFADVGSTNSVARDLAARAQAEGDGPHHLAVAADHQRHGRGRRARRWLAPPGSSVLLSAAWTWPWDPERAPVATMAMALAAGDAVAQHCGLVTRIKWPNDILVPGSAEDRGEDPAKLAGILGERHGSMVIVGLGLNVDWPGPLPPGGVDIAGAGGRPADPRELAQAVLVCLDGWIDRSPEEIVEALRPRCATLGRQVSLSMADGRNVVGRAAGLDDRGHLVVRTATGDEVVAGGEVVHLRPA